MTCSRSNTAVVAACCCCCCWRSFLSVTSRAIHIRTYIHQISTFGRDQWSCRHQQTPATCLRRAVTSDSNVTRRLLHATLLDHPEIHSNVFLPTFDVTCVFQRFPTLTCIHLVPCASESWTKVETQRTLSPADVTRWVASTHSGSRSWPEVDRNMA